MFGWVNRKIDFIGHGCVGDEGQGTCGYKDKISFTNCKFIWAHVGHNLQNFPEVKRLINCPRFIFGPTPPVYFN